MVNPLKLFFYKTDGVKQSILLGNEATYHIRYPFYKKVSAGKGFTLVELIVSIAIIGLITSIVVFNQGDLSDSVSVGNVVGSISAEIRQAQVYGISVKEFTPSSNDFSVAYGVDFDISSTGNNTQYYSFADRSVQNGYYDASGGCIYGGTSECLATNQIGRGNTISSICVIQANGDCNIPISRVAITFLRPNPAAQIVFFNNGGNIVSYPGFLGVKIQITSPKNRTKDIVVYTTGQISTP